MRIRWGWIAVMGAATAAAARQEIQKRDDAPEAKAIGIVESRGDAGATVGRFAGVLVAPDLVVTLLDMVDQATEATFTLPCCDAVRVVGVVRVDEPAHIALLRVEPAAGHAAPIDVSDEPPVPGQTWHITLMAVKDVGIMSGPFEILGVREWPIEGRLVWNRAPMSSIPGMGIALDGRRRLRGICIGDGGNHTSLFSLVTPEMIVPGELIPIEHFGTRDLSPLMHVRRVEERGYKGDRRIEAMREALKLEPRLWRTQWYIGVLLHEAGRPEEALVEFGKAVELTPWFSEPYYSSGLVCYRQNRFEESITWFDRTLGADPRYANAAGSKAAALFQLGRHDECIAAARESIRIDPKEWRFTQNLCYFLKQMGKRAEAIAVLREFCQAAPNEVVGWQALASHLQDDGDLGGAEKAVRDGIKHLPESPALYRSLAACLAKKEDKAGTIGALRKVLELDPDAKDADDLREMIDAVEHDFQPRK